MKNPSDIENQLLHKTSPVCKSSVHEMGAVGHCPRHFRANTVLEVGKHSKCNSQSNVKNDVKTCILANGAVNFMISLSNLGVFIEKNRT